MVPEEFILPRGDGSEYFGKIIESKRGHDENLKGILNEKPILDTREHVYQ